MTRQGIVTAARWCVANKPAFRYLEDRPFPLFIPTDSNPIHNDCSATSVLCCWMAKAPEPYPGAYGRFGNTESFLQLEHVTGPLGGDFVVYGEGLPLGDQHMAVVLEAGTNPMTMSHGMSAEPAFVNAIQGCPLHAQGRITYVRAYPVPIPPVPLEETMNPVLTTNPNNNGIIVLDTANGTFQGVSNSAVLDYLENTCKIPRVAAPSKAVFAKFKQTGTI